MDHQEVIPKVNQTPFIFAIVDLGLSKLEREFVVLVVPEVKLESGPREMQMNLSSLTCAPGNTYSQASDYTYLTVAIHDMIHSFHCSVVLVVLIATTNVGPGSIITIV